MLLTPALTGQLIDQAGTYIWQGLRLTPGTSVDDGIRAYTSGLPDGYQVNVQRTDTQVDRVGRSVRPLVVALAVFGSAAALAAVALGGLGALRLMGAAATDTQALQAVGLSRRARRTIVAAPALTAAVAGALGAIGLSIALSPLMPIGAVREVEPDPGLDVDTTAVLLGGLVIGLLVAAVAFAAAQRVTRPGTSASPRVLRPSWLVQRIAGLGLGPIAVVGAGHAVGGERRSGVPTRSTLVACAISVVALATAITFGASVRAFLDTPASYGWAADLAIHSGGGYDYLDPEGAGLVLDEPGIEALSVGGFGLVRLGDREVNTLGLVAAGGELLVTVVEGSAPVEGDEIALGASTARELKVGVGDQVEGPAGRLRVVGIVALPALGPIASAHPSLGQGALVALEALPELDQNGYPSMALVRLADGLDVDQEGDRITVAVTEAMSESTPDFAAHYTDLRPSEVVALGPATRTAYLLAALLGAAAVLALGLTLSASVRRRHQTYAVLSALGFDRGDLRQTVRWESNLVVFSALVLGLPIGVALGRVAWTAFSDQLGGAGGPRVPLVLLTGAVAALVVVANLVGELPARTAGRRRIPRALSQQR